MAKQEKLELQATLNELIFQVERQDTIIREMSRTMADLESRPWTKILQKVQSATIGEVSNSNRKNGNFTSDYNPERSLIFKALHTLETDNFNKNIAETSRKP
jgi:hypothetical protein